VLLSTATDNGIRITGMCACDDDIKFSVLLLYFSVLLNHHLCYTLPLTYVHLLKYQSLVSEDIQRNIYADNIISGLDNEVQQLQYYTQARHIMGKANFNLRSWATNSTTLQKTATAVKSTLLYMF